MDQYLLNDILDYNHYLVWRDKINQVNTEYHQIYYYGKSVYNSNLNLECQQCQQCHKALWNWRTDDDLMRDSIFHVFCAEYCYDYRDIHIKLPKKY